MKTGIKLVIFMAVFVLAALAIGGGLVFGSRVYGYMARQGFDLQTAVQWTLDGIAEEMRKEGDKNNDPIIIEMVNRNIQIVACTAL